MVRFIAVLSLLVGSFIVSGCASSVPSATFKTQIAESMRICSVDETKVKLTKAEGIEIHPGSMVRFETLIQEAIDAAKKKQPCLTSEKRSYVLNGKLTRYEAGNSFARLMFAGLGQMHIDGDFVLDKNPSSGAPLSEFSISKTFAWGGVYGATTNLFDLEQVVAKGVAESVSAKE